MWRKIGLVKETVFSLGSGGWTDRQRNPMEVMKRSVSIPYFNSQTIIHVKIVYRVNWLRARARAQRWDEEKVIVAKEMDWVIRTFGFMREAWEERARKMGDEKLGHKAYAMKEAERWQRWAETARVEFAKVLDV